MKYTFPTPIWHDDRAHTPEEKKSFTDEYNLFPDSQVCSPGIMSCPICEYLGMNEDTVTDKWSKSELKRLNSGKP